MSLKKTAVAVGLAVALGAGTAHAQVQTPGPFGSITGFYGFRGGTETEVFTGGGGLGAVSPGRALGGTIYGGYRFSEFDFALGVGGLGFSRRSTLLGATNITNEARVWTFDLEAGYNAALGSVGIRPFVGIRYANWKHVHQATAAGATLGTSDVDVWGLGPRVGVDGAVKITDAINIFAGAAGSVLFGRLNQDGFVVGGANPASGTNRTTFNFDGKIGIAFEPIPLVSIAAGYRVEYWNGVDLASWTTVVGGPGAGRGNRFTHGPFVRVAYNIGPPGPAMAAPVPPPVDTKTTSYMVFFDFDRANITPTAATTIKQAADSAKAGKATRIGVTGHADRSGSDAYNMALSLRRANAVKDQLVREGIPAAAIAVVGRGESQPLVQTADGVREPQNRRVEIVLQ